MNCLVVVAHPLKDSLCHYLSNKTISHLENKGYKVTVKDVYKENFNPVLTQDERESYYQGPFDERLLQAELKQLKEVESLVLIFPTWWFGFPAILKGWFDRVWAPGHAYEHASDYGPMIKCLDNLKEMKVVTTLGSPWWVDNLVLRKPVKKILKIELINKNKIILNFIFKSFFESANC